MDENTTIIVIGDVHLGTACSGVPENIASLGVDATELTPAAALKRSVDLAVEREADAVLFAGDVVESTNARYEAMVPLEESIRRLRHADIPVLAVAGNHDVEALPRLATLIEGFTLLGAGGRWETRSITRHGTPVMEVVGWSFGERVVRHSPVAQFLSSPLEAASPSVPRVGLLHADLDASGGRYAPVRREELNNAGLDAWLLGHIHKPSIEDLSAPVDGRPSGYLGSLVGLDPSETGPHGPWLLTVGGGGELRMAQVPLAPLRWENVAVSVEGLEDAEDVPDRLLAEAEGLVRRIGEEGPAPLAIGVRAQLTGACSRLDDIRQRIGGGDWKDLGRVIHGTAVFFNRIIDRMSTFLDLEEVARGEDPAALLARRLLVLGQDNKESEALLAEARLALGDAARDERWRPVQEHRNSGDPLSDVALRETLIRSGTIALSAMLSQTGRDGPG